MSFQIGIVGLPNVGKSTLFNALCSGKALVENYPFTTIEPNTGIVAVPDDRLGRVTLLSPTQKVVPAFLELAPAADRGECTVELEDASGAKMRVHLMGVPMPDLAALSRSFWNPAS